MNRRMIKSFSFFLSFLVHIVLVAWLFGGFGGQIGETNSRWRGGDAIWVSVAEFSDSAAVGSDHPVSAETKPSKDINAIPKPKSQKPSTNTLTANVTNSNFGAGGNGIDDDGSASPSTLAVIRARIDRHKFMPLAAQEQNLSGTVKLSFQIDAQGRVAALTIVKSSGHSALDKAALSTVQKAAPLPFYKNPIAIELEYQ